MNKPILTLTSKIGYYDDIELSPVNVLELGKEDLEELNKGDIVKADIIEDTLINSGILKYNQVSDKNYDYIFTDEENNYLGKMEQMMNDSIYKVKFVTKSSCKILNKEKNNISILIRFESYNIDTEGVITKVRDDSSIENLKGFDICLENQ